MIQRLLDKVAVVTGGAAGIGQAIAVLFAREGAKVVVGDVHDAGGAGTIALIREAGGEGQFVHCDVGIGPDVDNLVEAAVRTYGRLDVVVNNAAIDLAGSAHELSEEEWARCLNVNLASVYRGIKASVSHLAEQGGGSIISIASIQGLVAYQGYAAYAASKGGVVQLTRQAAFDYGPHRIRVNCICPGAVRTAMNPTFVDPTLDEGVSLREEVEAIPLARIGEPIDIAYAALFLASDESSWLTGQAIVVDGGISIKGP